MKRKYTPKDLPAI
jgi:hypothetical protein